ncbi:MAG: LysR family transcriptional regulator [Clostridiales bacterium]|nr:LysR family transcriptional regulator [Clostridiales bacterium]
MEIRNMITFQKIYEYRSFSKAAMELGYSQSTVTMQIKQLEGELNVRLFDRIGKTVNVTNEGERFIHYVNEIIACSNNAIADLTSDSIPRGEIRIGILESVCTAYLPQILHEYHITYPGVSTVIQIGTYDELTAMLNANKIDLIWILDQPLQNIEWVKAFSYDSSISVICSPRHKLLKKNQITIEDLKEETFLFTEKNCSYRKVFEDYLNSVGVYPKIFLEIGNTEIIKKFVQADIGLSVLPYFTLIEELAANKLSILHIKDCQFFMQGQLFYHKSKWLSPALSEFIELVKGYNFN